MTKIKQSKQELEEQLKHQICFLFTSCRAYDEGSHAEAKRIAAILRILFHETRKSRSLLGQLRLLEISWIDTSSRYDPESLNNHVGLASIRFEHGRIPWLIPRGLPDGKINKLEFNKWWSHPVIVAITGTHKIYFSRRDIVLNVADTDGGAHVDPELQEMYHVLSRKNGVGYTAIKDGQRYPMLYPELPCLRQIAHEVLLTLQERYSAFFEERYESEIKILPYGPSTETDETTEISIEIYTRKG